MKLEDLDKVTKLAERYDLLMKQLREVRDASFISVKYGIAPGWMYDVHNYPVDTRSMDSLASMMRDVRQTVTEHLQLDAESVRRELTELGVRVEDIP